MILYGISNPGIGGLYGGFDEISTYPDNLNYVQGSIIWYQEINLDGLVPLPFNLRDGFSSNWEIWECDCRIFNCTMDNDGILDQDKSFKGIAEIIYEEGKLIRFKYYKSNKDFSNNKPTIDLNGNI